MGDSYIRRRTLGILDEASEELDRVSEKSDVVDLTDDSRFDVPDVSESDPEFESVPQSFSRDSSVVSPSSEFDEDISGRAFSANETVKERTEGHEFAEDADAASQTIKQIQDVNEKLKERGSNRRYVVTAANVPETAYTYKDDVGEFYFETDTVVRPSSVAPLDKEDSWWSFSEDEKVLKTVLELAEEFPELVQHADTVEKAYTFTDRVLKTEDEVVRDEDVFSLKQQDAIVTVLVEARE